MTPQHPTARIVLAATALLLVATPALAVEYTFGSTVGSADYDFTPVPSSQKVALCFIDIAGDGVPNQDDLLVMPFGLSAGGICSSELAKNALLLNSAQGRTPGTEITGTDRWMSKPLTNLTDRHAIRFVEEGTDGSKFDSKDTMYIDLVNLGMQVVDVGDLRLTALGTLAGGRFVVNGDLDLNRPLINLGGNTGSAGSTKQFNDTNVLYKAGSAYYINADLGTLATLPGDIGVETNDIRLNPKAVNPLSDAAFVLPDHIQIVQATVAPGQPFQVMVTAKNTGKIAGVGLIETRVADLLVDARGTPSIEPNGFATVAMTLIAPTVPGTYAVKAGTYGDFLVVESPTQESAAVVGSGDLPAPALQGASQGAPGLAPLLVLCVLLGLGAWLRRTP